jgi:hypothetical protein
MLAEGTRQELGSRAKRRTCQVLLTLSWHGFQWRCHLLPGPLKGLKTCLEGHETVGHKG